jgi:hypothetical protein
MKGIHLNGKGRIGNEKKDNPNNAKKIFAGVRKISNIMMSISQAMNLTPKPAETSTGLEGSLTDAPQFWQKIASSVN